MKVSIKYFKEVLIQGELVELKGTASATYWEGRSGTHWYPAEPDEVNDIEVILDGINITDTMDEKELEELAEQLRIEGFEQFSEKQYKGD
jgi:hypothetical protein